MTNLYILRQLEWIHCAIQEAMSGNDGELERALYMLEDIREHFIRIGVISEGSN